MHGVHLVIQGRVQGVGFRYYVMRRAQALGLTGWVRNTWSGDVEVEVEGDHASLEQLVDLVGHGPTSARVDSVRAEWHENPRGYDRFWVRPNTHPPGGTDSPEP